MARDRISTRKPNAINAEAEARLGGDEPGVARLLQPTLADAPTVVAPIDDQIGTEDIFFSFTFAANVFSDPDMDELTYSAELVGGAPLPAWLSFDGSTRTFSGTPELDFNGDLDIVVTATDEDDETVSDTFKITFTPVNDAPVPTIGASSYSATEAVPLDLKGTLSVSDVDAGTEQIYVQLTVDHGILIVEAGTSGATVSFSGTDTVLIYGSQDQINALFNTDPDSVVTYTAGDRPPASATLTLYVNDQGFSGADGYLEAQTDQTIDITAVQADPVVANFDTDSVTWTEGESHEFLDAGGDATLLDENVHFDGGTLTVSIASGGVAAEDKLVVEADGTVSIVGDDVFVDSTLIGTKSGGTNGTDLVITFNSDATPARVQELLQAIAYANDHVNLFQADPTPGTRTLSYTLTDGDGGTETWGSTVEVEIGPLSIGNLVFLDANASGVFDAGDSGIAGVTVELYDDLGNVIATDVTDSNGLYNFDGLIAGDYEVRVVAATLPAGYTSVLGASDPDDDVDNDDNGDDITLRSGLITLTEGGEPDTPADGDGTNSNATVDFGFVGPPIVAVPPSVDLDGTSAATDFSGAYSEGGATAPIGDTIDVTQGTAPITSATITIPDWLAGDLLAIEGTLPGTISKDLINSTDTNLILLGTPLATAADWEAALALVRYSSSSDNPDNYGNAADTARSITVTLSDGVDSSNVPTATIAITAVSDAPVVTDFGAAVTYNEDDPYVLLDFMGDAAISDVDNLNFDGGNLSFGMLTTPLSEDSIYVQEGGLVTLSGSDVLVDGTTIGQIVVAIGGGELLRINLNSNATPAAVQELLHQIAYTNSAGDNPTGGTRNFVWILNDGNPMSGGAGTGGGVDVTVIAENDAPVLTASAGTTAFVEGANVASTPVAVDPGLIIADPDSPILNATVQVTTGAGDDVLAFTNDDAGLYGNIVQVNAPGSSVVQLESSGATATLAQWQAALRAITYTSTSEDPATTDRVVTFTVSDGTDFSNSVTKTVSVAATNDAPEISVSPLPRIIAEDGSVTIAPLQGISVSDVDAASLTVTLSVEHGTLTLGDTTGLTFDIGDGSGDATMTFSGTIAAIQAALDSGVTYVPDANYSGTDTLSVDVTDNGATGDGGPQTDSDSISITINSVNDGANIELDVGGPYRTIGTYDFMGFPPTLIDPTIDVGNADEDRPRTAATSDGGWVMVWTQSGAPGNILAQRFHANGDLNGGVIEVSNASAPVETQPAVTSVDGGGFAVVFVESGQITVAIFDALGSLLVTMSPPDTGAEQTPTITRLSTGELLVTWEVPGGSSTEVYGVRVDSDGNMVDSGPQLIVAAADNFHANLNPTPHSITALAGGSFAIAWVEGGDVNVKVITPGASWSSGAVTTLDLGSANDRSPSVTALTDGRFVVVWEASDGGPSDLWGQFFTAAGDADGLPVLLTDGIPSSEFEPNVTALDDGGFALTWLGNDGVNTTLDVRLRTFDSAGAPVGDTASITNTGFTANPGGAAINERHAALTTLSDGRIVLSWIDPDPDTFDPRASGDDIRYQIFDPGGAPQLVGNAGATSIVLPMDISLFDDSETLDVVIIQGVNDYPGLSLAFGRPDDFTYDPGNFIEPAWVIVRGENAADDDFLDALLAGAAEIEILLATPAAIGFTFNLGITAITSDGGPPRQAVTRELTITFVNAPPSLTDLAASVTFDENLVNAAPDLLDADVTFTDANGNFAGGTLTVSGLVTDDQVQIRDQGTDPGEIGIDGTDVTFGGITIGSFVGGIGATLTVTFNAAATAAAIEALIQNLTYRTLDDTPAPSRTLTIQVTDAAGATLTPGSTNTIQVNVTPANDAPNGADKTITIDEDIPHIFVLGDFGFSDPDGHAFHSVTFTALPADGVIYFDPVGSPPPAAIAEGASYSVADIMAGRLFYIPGLNGNGTGYASFTFQVRDASGSNDLDPIANTITFDVDPVNDGPSVVIDPRTSVPEGVETRVNTNETLSIAVPTVATLADGGYLVTWGSFGLDGDNFGVFAQRFNSAGTAVGGEFRVNSSTNGQQGASNIGALLDGGFVVVWQSDHTGASAFEIYAQRYDSTGTAVGGEVRVNTTIAGLQLGPVIAVLLDGSYVVAWNGTSDGAGVGYFAQRYNAAGVAQGGEFRINTTTAGTQFNNSNNAIAALADGGFVVTWQSQNQDGSGFGIYAQRYNASGVAQGGEFRANTFAAGDQAVPAAVALAGGGFVLVWQSSLQDGSGFGIFAQRYDSAGVAQSGEFRVSSFTPGNQQLASVAALSEGGFVVTWESFGQDGSDRGIYAQRYDADGVPMGNELVVSSFAAGGQRDPSVAALDDDRFVIVWNSLDQLGPTSSNIYAQRFENGFGAGEQGGVDLKGSIQIGDPDEDPGTTLRLFRGELFAPPETELTVTLEVDHGTLTVTAGGSGATVGGSGSDTVTITGTLAQIRALLLTDATSTVVYNTATSDTPPSSAAFSVTVTDGEETASATQAILITQVNDAPVITPGGPTSVIEDIEAALTGIQIADDGAPDDLVTLSLSVGHGTLEIRVDVPDGITEAMIVAGAQGTSGITIVATIAEINATLAAMNGLVYQGDPDYFGPDALSITVSDTVAGDPLELASPTNIATSTAPTGLVAGDLDGDGDLDIAYIAGGQVQVRLGNGDGTFAAETGYAAGSNLSELQLVDQDGDLDLDILAVDHAAGGSSFGTVGVLANNGNGTFAPFAPIVSEQAAYDVALVDLNGDGLADLIVDRRDYGLVSVRLGIAPGTYGPAANYSTTNANYYTSDIVVGDVNGDGRADLIAIQGGDRGSGNPPGSVTVLLNNGAGGFLAPVDIATGLDNPREAAIGDLDGDGDLDVVYTAVGATPGLHVLFGNGDGSFSRPGFIATGAVPVGVGVADLNGDGLADLITGTQGAPGNLKVYLGNGNGVFTAAPDMPIGTNGDGAITGDFDGDGDLDVIVANFSSASLSIFFNQTTDRTATASHAINVSPVNDAPAIDLNGNGSGTGVTRDYTENGAPLSFSISSPSSQATFKDVDSADLNGGNLTVTFTANGHADDRLTIVHQGNGAGQIGISGNVVSYSGTAIGTFAGGGDGSTPLVISFTSAAATPEAVQQLLRAIAYSNVSDNPSTLPRSVSFTANDGDGGAGLAAVATVNVTALNDAPTVNGLSNNTGLFIEGGAPVLLDAPPTPATLTDPDSPDFGGGSLTVAIGAGGVAAEDVLSIAFSLQLSGGSGIVNFNSVQFATYTGGTNGAPLVFTFNGNASQAAVQTLIRAIQYSNTNLVNPSTGPRTITWTLVDGDGVLNGGVDTRVLTSFAAVSGVNDAPSGTDKTITLAEDGSVVLTADDFGFSDVDGHSLIAVYITTPPSAGALLFNGTPITTPDFFVTKAQIDEGRLVFEPADNANGTGYASFTFQVVDGGGTTNDGEDTDQSANRITFDVTAVNDAPVNNVPVAQSADEDVPFVFSTANSNAISVGDIDAGSSSLQVTLSVAHGTLTLSGIGGLDFTDGDGTADTTMTFTGTIAAINAALNGMSYTSALHYNGPDSLSILTSDQGATGSGGALSDSDSVAITVNPLNDAPQGTDNAVTLNEDASFTLTAAMFGFSDPVEGDDFAGVVITTIPVPGTLRYNGSAVVAGQFVSAADIGLGLLTFQAAAHANGTPYTSFTFQVRDDGASGGGNQNTDQNPNSFVFNVTAVNDAPTNNVPGGTQTINEDGALTLSTANLNAISVADLDAATLTVTLSVAHGTLTLTSTSGLSFSGGSDGTNDATMTFSGTAAAINAAFGAGLTYNPTAHYNGPDAISVVTSDTGQTGTGGTLMDSDSVAITINPVNDAPSGTNATLVINEDTPRTLTQADFGFSDPVEGHLFAGVVIATLPGNGTLLLNGTAITVAGTFVTAAQISANQLVFRPDANENGASYASFDFQVRDNGDTLNGGQNTDQSANTLTINVTAVNDAPVVTITPRSGGETRVNSVTAGDQDGPLVAVLANGGYVVTWTSNGQDGGGRGVYAQRYNADGVPQGIEIRVNTTTANDQYAGGVAALSGGGYVVTWMSFGQDGSGFGVYAQRYDTNGDPQGGEVHVSTTTTGDQFAPEVAALSGGGYVIAWSSPGDGEDFGVFSQRYDANGVAQGGQTLVNTTTANLQSIDAITALSDGGYLIVWTSHGGPDFPDTHSGVYAQRYNASGVAVGGETLVNTTLAGSQRDAEVALLTGGGYVIVWDSIGQDGDMDGVYAQRYDANGVRLGGEVQVNSYTTLSQSQIAVAALSDGGYLVTWQSFAQDGSQSGVYAQRYAANGVAVGGEFRINATTADYQHHPSVVGLAGGDYLVAWGAANQDGSGFGIYTQRYEPGFEATEQVGLNLKGSVTVGDVDAGNAVIVATLSVGYGILNVTAGGSGAAVGGNGTGTVTLTGTLAQINALLHADPTSTIVYTAHTDAPPASTTLTVSVNDGGATGVDPGLSGDGDDEVGTAQVAIAINAVNDAPTGTSNSVSVNEDTALTLTAAMFGFSDPGEGDDFAGVVITTIPVPGTLRYNGTAVVAGQFVSAADIGLGLLTFQAAANANGTPFTSFTFQVRDDGDTANGGQNTDQSPNTLTINVTAVNDAPVNSVPVAQTINEDGAFTLSTANSNAISVADVDASTLTVTLSVAHGALTLTSTAGLSFSGGSDGTNDATMTFSGTAPAINAALGAGLTYNPTADYSGPDAISVVTSDTGQTGTGGTLMDSDSVAITVNPVNDAPVVDLNGTGGGVNAAVSYTEDAAAVAIGSGITVTDADSGLGDLIVGAVITLTDAVAGDALTVSGSLPGGITAITTTPAGQIVITLSGAASQAAYATAIAQIRYATTNQNPTFGGTDPTRTITVTVNDGDVSSAVATSTVTITPVNDPAVAAADSFTITESGSIVAGNLFANDADPDGPALAISAVNGGSGNVGTQITLASGALLTVNANGTFNYNPNGAFLSTPTAGSGAVNTPGQDSFTYTLAGGNTVTVTITLTGLDTNDLLIGTAGTDTLAGGAGNDTYLVTAGDTVIEASSGDFDIVYALTNYALNAGAEVELLSAFSIANQGNLNLTGNERDNVLAGTLGNNVLNGNGGFDVLNGFAGDDVYIVDGDDVVFDDAAGAAGGFDIVYAIASHTLTGGQQIEMLSAFSTGWTSALNLTGNGANNVLAGTQGANVLNGGGGADVLNGFAGDDVYVVDGDDVVFDDGVGAAGGFDTVYALANYTLTAGQQIELLSAFSIANQGALNLTGNNADNTLVGTNGANTLDGKGGNDYLVAFAGADNFAFTTALNAATNLDRIEGFQAGVDEFLLDDAIFAGLAIGALNPNAFVVGPAALDADDRIIYNQATAQLFYDADGSGSGAAVLFAVMVGTPSLTAADFTVI